MPATSGRYREIEPPVPLVEKRKSGQSRLNPWYEAGFFVGKVWQSAPGPPNGLQATDPGAGTVDSEAV